MYTHKVASWHELPHKVKLIYVQQRDFGELFTKFLGVLIYVFEKKYNVVKLCINYF